jgi:hypothetical protein
MRQRGEPCRFASTELLPDLLLQSGSMTRMTKRERVLLSIRFYEVEAELHDIAKMRVVGDDDGDPAAAEDDQLWQPEENE